MSWLIAKNTYIAVYERGCMNGCVHILFCVSGDGFIRMRWLESGDRRNDFSSRIDVGIGQYRDYGPESWQDAGGRCRGNSLRCRPCGE